MFHAVSRSSHHIRKGVGSAALPTAPSRRRFSSNPPQRALGGVEMSAESSGAPEQRAASEAGRRARLDRLTERLTRQAPSLRHDGSLSADLWRLSGPDVTMMEALADLCGRDHSIGHREGSAEVASCVPGLVLACRRPAVGALRRRYIMGLCSRPLDAFRHYYMDPALDSPARQGILEALALCRFFLAPASRAWRRSEAKLFRALPGAYRGDPWPESWMGGPQLSTLLFKLQSMEDPARCAVAVERWSHFGSHLKTFDQAWCTFLSALTTPEWEEVAGLRGGGGRSSDTSPLQGDARLETLRKFVADTTAEWRAAVVPPVLQVPDVGGRLDCLRHLVGLSTDRAGEAIGLANTYTSKFYHCPDRFLDKWVRLSVDWQELMLQRLVPHAGMSSHLLNCLEWTARRQAPVQQRMRRALLQLATEGRLGELDYQDFEVLQAWHEVQARPLLRPALDALRGIPEGAVAAFALQAEFVPTEVVTVAYDCCRAQTFLEEDQRDMIGCDSAAIMEACCEAYLLASRPQQGSEEGKIVDDDGSETVAD